MRIKNLCGLISALWLGHAAHAADTNGFAVKFTSADGKSSDTLVLPNLWLFVEAGQPATPFVPPGKFTAEFSGSISADLRGTHFFKAEQLNGALSLEINGKPVLSATGTGGASDLSKGVQLNKGANAVKATFTSAGGDAFARVGWTEKGTNVGPIPNPWITHAVTPELEKAQTLHSGRGLFLEHRCAKCHEEKFTSPVPELAMDAPSFDLIGSRRNSVWLAKWIADPKAMRARVSMPRLFHGTTAKEASEAVAVYLCSLTNPVGRAAQMKVVDIRYIVTDLDDTNSVQHPRSHKAIAEISKRSGPNAKATLDGAEDQPAGTVERKPLFERLHCTGCHSSPGGSENDAAKISLRHVAQKFSAGKLAEFLRAPDQHYAWNPMPDFKLAEVEAKELADHLLKHADAMDVRPAPTDKAVIERGRALVQSSGCLACHSLSGTENRLTAPPMAKLAKQAKGCLAEKRDEKSSAPDFTFSVGERQALLAFVQTDFTSLSRHAPLDAASRVTREMQCSACHGQIDFVPPLDVLGGKLKPEWAAEFIAGHPFKIRADKHPKGEPWLEARMPAFKSRAKLIAAAMAMQQGYPPKTPDEGPVDQEAAKIGHKMIGKDNGLSCIACHAVNEVPAPEVFESEGVNLGLSSARLLKPYFFRWLRAPLAIDPQTKMPGYFEDGRSALTDYYDGDGEKQINALYEYIRLGEKMPAPSLGQ